jgi:S1-C subfamily serine protease
MKKIKLYAILLILGMLGKTAYPQASPDVIENVLSSVVTVAIFKTDIVKTPLGFRGETAPDVAYEKALEMSGSQSSGSGFIIEVDGTKYVITNAHVVQDASQDPGSIFIYSVNQTKYEMRLKGGDSFFDIAVLEFVDEPGDEITTVKFKKDEPRIGENVYAIGNPLGTYPYTVTDGIISAKNRMREGNTGKFGYLQSTATIIWGNSGGPLIDQNGDVAGVNTKIAFAAAPSGEQVLQSQLNFALEAKIAERLVNDIIKNDGYVNRSYLGIEVSQRYKYVSYGRNSQFILVDDRRKFQVSYQTAQHMKNCEF